MKNTTMTAVLCMLLSSTNAQEKKDAEYYWNTVSDPKSGMTT
jgi:hypothetical protein